MIALGALLTLAPRLAAAEAVTVPPGQEDVFADMLGRGRALPGGCVFTGGAIDAAGIRATYACAEGEVELHLEIREAAPTSRFAVTVGRGQPPVGLVDAITGYARAREGEIVLRSTPPVRDAFVTVSWVAIATLLVLVIVADVRRLAGLRATTASRRSAAAFVVVIRAVGLAIVLGLAVHAVPHFAAFHWPSSVLRFGVVAVGTFYWLVITGFFGYGDPRRDDWPALIGFLVALAVREVLTLHSIQEIEIQFVSMPHDKHSFLYPQLQMLFLPVVADPHRFMMHLNGVLGAAACLPLYLFARRRLSSRLGGVLAAVFFALHPLVARFAPTDGVYSLLLATWFAGLALLTNPHLGGRGIFGGGVLLAIAATLRIEGLVYLAASLFLLNIRQTAAAVGRYPAAATGVAVVSVILVTAHLLVILPLNIGNVPGWPPVESLMTPAVANGPIYAGLVVFGAIAGISTGRWVGAGALAATIIMTVPVAHSEHVVAQHRLVPTAAVQALLAGIGAWSLVVRVPYRWRALAASVAVAVALGVLVAHRDELTRPYVFTETYQLVRDHLAPTGAPPPGCTLLAFAPPGDSDIHDFAQVVPGMRVIDCRVSDCAAIPQSTDCVYYIRSVTAYLQPIGAACTEGRSPCLNDASASFERRVDLEAVATRVVEPRQTFAELGDRYPAQAEIGLFRVRPRGAAGDVSG